VNPRALARPLATIVLLGSLTACGGGSTSPSNTPTPTPTAAPSTSFSGTLEGDSQSGSLTITVAAAISGHQVAKLDARALSTTNVTGTLIFTNGGGTVSLSGTLDTATGAFSISGGGFTLTGVLANGQINGTYTGPNGESGVFGTLNDTTNTVKAYCGTYVSTVGSSEVGVWNIQVSSTGTVTGGACPTNRGPGHCVTLSGTLNGTSLSMISNEGAPVKGTVQNGTVNGTYSGGDHAGTFSGAACGQ
jgi:hypothetical protein